MLRGRKGGNPLRCRKCGMLAGKDLYCKSCRPTTGIADAPMMRRDSFMPEFGGHFGRDRFLTDKFGIISDKFGLEK